ncbi:MAG: PIN domain-containing protein [Candidatus Methanomethylicaceae archaeon]
MKEEEEKVIFDAYIFKGILGVKPYIKVYSKFLERKNHKLIMSTEIFEKYQKAIKRNSYSPIIARGIIGAEIEKLKFMQKLRWADRKINEMKENDIKVRVEDEDDMPFVKAAFALGAKYIITQDEKHFFSKKQEFKQHGIEVISPEEYIKDFE